MPERYNYFDGFYPDIRASITVRGPQQADQIPAEVRALLDKKHIKQVLIVYDWGQGEKISGFSVMQESTDAP